jgi:predicted anti-sigma-YlaC factor YlaD
MRLLLTCKQAHRMVSEGLDRNLGPLERGRLRIHLSICDACTNFNRQMTILHRSMKYLPLNDDSKDDAA